MKTKNLFTKISLLIFGLFFTQLSSSQENYVSGYLIKLSGETLKGFVDYRNWDRNPDNIFFKEELNGKKSNYTALEIKAFGVLGEKYESAIVESEISPVNLNNLLPNPELNIILDTIFLQTLIQGEKSLYYSMNEIGNDQFYVKIDGKHELLLYKKYLKIQDGADVAAENKKYLGQLAFYLKECTEIPIKLRDTKYSKSSIKDLFLLYYSCTESEFEFMKKKETVKVEFGVLAGASITNIEFKGDEFEYLVNPDFSQSVDFSTGVFIDLILPRNQEKWSIYNELTFTSYESEGRFDDIVNDEHYTYYFTTFGYSYLKLNNMIRFNYPIGGGSVFFNVGISNGLAISETNYRKREVRFYATESVEEELGLEVTRKYEQAYILGLGAKYKKFSIELRQLSGNGMSDYVALNSISSSYHFLLGFRF